MRTKFMVLGISLLLVACSLNQYLVADKYLQRKDYQNALKEYVRIAELNGSLTLSRDVRALTGAMIAYYNLANYQKSFALCKRILALDKHNGCAIFYAGMNLEMLNKKSLARKLFAYYRVLPPQAPYAQFLKAKFNQYRQEEIEKRLQLALQTENSIGPEQLDQRTVGVLYFVNVMEEADWNPLSKGLAEMMITDLSQVSRLKVLERVYIQKLVEELRLGSSGLTDDSTIPRMGRLLKASKLVTGAFTIKAGQNLTITTKLADVTASGNFESKEFEGALKQIFDLEKQIVLDILDQMNIELTPGERQRISRYATRNWEAFKVYCQGLESYDLGDYEAARAHFAEATRLDPNFSLALDLLQVTDAYNSIEQGTFTALHFAIARSTTAAGFDMAAQVGTEYRLYQMATNLDLGYLPGNDARNEALDLISQDWFWNSDWRDTGPLEPPPAPPTLTPNQ